MDKDKAKIKKEAALEEKMKLIRKKDEERLKRLKEIEEDRANADMYSDQVARNSTRNQMMGVRRESPSTTKQFQRGRGQLLSKMSQENLKANKVEEKRKQNFKREEERSKRASAGQSSASGFLVDDRRADMGKTTGRSPHSYGGAHIDGAVIRMSRERNNVKQWGNNPEMCMSRKERLEYKEWQEERRKIDASRNERQKKGEKSREWDEKKEWDGKKGMWLDSNSARVRSRNDPPIMDAKDSWGEDTIEKVWDGKNRRWVDPREAVSFGDTEGQDEDWGSGEQQKKSPSSERWSSRRKQRFSSSSEGSGGDSRAENSPRHYAEIGRGVDKPEQFEGRKCDNKPRREIKGPRQTEPTTPEDDLQVVSNEDTSDMVENSTATGEYKEGIPAADAKPKRVNVRRQRGSGGRKTERESKESQNQLKGGASKKGKKQGHDEALGQQVNCKDTKADDVFFHEDQSARQEGHDGAEVEKTKEDDNSDNNQLGTAAEGREEKRSEHSENRKESFEFVPISPFNKGIPLEWGDVEIDDEQLVLDTAITTVKW